MREDKKIPLSALRNALEAQHLYHNDPEQAIQTVLYGWLKHPKYPSPSRSTINVRIRTDGFCWLKPNELPSFEAYCGYPLRK